MLTPLIIHSGDKPWNPRLIMLVKPVIMKMNMMISIISPSPNPIHCNNPRNGSRGTNRLFTYVFTAFTGMFESSGEIVG